MDTQQLSPLGLAAFFDHTLLRPEATAGDIEKLCAEARQYHFYGVCVNGSRVELARHMLEDTSVKIITVIGFPLGAVSSDAKRFEVEAVIDEGVHEVDVVINVGRLRDGEYKYVLRELRDVVEAADEHPVKVILETSLLTREEIIRACELTVESGALFVKTSTGFSSRGATLEDVRLLRETVGPKFGVKASGGISDAKSAKAMIAAGATRLGASASVAIVRELAELQPSKS